MNSQRRHEIFSRLRAANPHPTTELKYSTPFELLVAVILSAQATDVSVNAATRHLFPVANTPQALLDLGEKKLSEYVKVAEAAEILGVSQNTVRAWTGNGKLRSHRNPANGYRLFRRIDLQKFLAKVAKPQHSR